MCLNTLKNTSWKKWSPWPLCEGISIFMYAYIYECMHVCMNYIYVEIYKFWHTKIFFFRTDLLKAYCAFFFVMRKQALSKLSPSHLRALHKSYSANTFFLLDFEWCLRFTFSLLPWLCFVHKPFGWWRHKQSLTSLCLSEQQFHPGCDKTPDPALTLKRSQEDHPENWIFNQLNDI